MAIIQISKIQQRSGKLIDLPQLSDAEFGWATDSKRLFIGKSYPNENIEVLTSYSNISFSQIDGSGGNNLSILNAQNGEVMAFDGTNWVNKGGNAGGLVNLGNISNIHIGGGAIGYTIETDGTGNLSWTPKSTIIAYISAITHGANTVITTDDVNFFTEGLNVTITDVVGMTQLNGNSYYANVITSTSFELFSDPSLTLPINSTAFGVFPKTTATATTAVTNYISVSSNVGFSVNTPVVFSGTVYGGLVAGATYYITSIPSSGNVIVSETLGGASPPLTTTSGSWDMHAGGGRVISTIGGGGASRAGGANTTVQFNDTNLLQGSADFTFNKLTKILTVSNTISATLFTGTLTTNAQPNITSTGLLTGLVVGNITANTTFGNGIFTTTGNANIGNIGTGGQVIATGNVTGSNLFASGTANVTGNVNAGNVNSKFFGPLNGTVGATTANTGNFTTVAASSTVAATGNVSGGNLTTTGALAVTGNANVGNLGTGGLIIATGNVTGGNLVTGGVLLATGNANAANFNTTGLIVATGNVTGGNLNTGGVLSVTGNANVGNLGTGGLIIATGNVTGGNIHTGGVLTVTGNANVGNLGTGGLIVATGNITGGNLLTGGLISAVGNVSGANIGTAGLIVATGNITGGNINGPTFGAHNGTVGATTANTGNFTTIQASGIITTTGNVNGANITGSYLYGAGNNISNIQGPNVSGVVTNANYAAYAGNVTIAAQANITSIGNLTTLTTLAITTGANTTAGEMTGNWTLTAGSKLTATYADLAEFYSADAAYEPGTVLDFGGTAEVTISSDGSAKVAGVVTTAPAYIMNAACAGEFPVAIALQGRVPVKMRGPVSKGDMIVAAADGYARSENMPTIGTVIGKSLEDFVGVGVIEVAIGRL